MFYLSLLLISGAVILASLLVTKDPFGVIMGLIGLVSSDLILMRESNSRIEAKLSEIDSNEEKVKELTAANKQLREAFDDLYYDTGDQFLDEIMLAQAVDSEES